MEEPEGGPGGPGDPNSPRGIPLARLPPPGSHGLPSGYCLASLKLNQTISMGLICYVSLESYGQTLVPQIVVLSEF